MQRAEAGLGSELVVGLVLLDEILDDVKVTAVGGVEERSETFAVLTVHPAFEDLLVVFLEE